MAKQVAVKGKPNPDVGWAPAGEYGCKQCRQIESKSELDWRNLRPLRPLGGGRIRFKYQNGSVDLVDQALLATRGGGPAGY